MHLILSPHLDDAVLSLGGLLAREGGETIVATFFAGTPKEPLHTRWDKKCGFADSSEAMRARLEENKKALALLGVSDSHIINYDYLDLEYRVAQGSWSIRNYRLVSAISKDIESLLTAHPGPLSVYAPGVAIHPDHSLVKRAARAVARNSAGHVEFYFYQDMPYTLRLPSPARSFWRQPAEHPIQLSREAMQKKLAGIALYTSQVPHLGKQLLEKIETYAAAQAKAFKLSEPYCEVTYALS